MRISRYVPALAFCLVSGGAFAALLNDRTELAQTPAADQRIAALEIVGGDEPAVKAEPDQTESDPPKPQPSGTGQTATPQSADPLPPAAPVVFTTPLAAGGPDVEGRTLEQLIEGSPLFPPIEGLPEQLWKGKTCSTCHQWTRTELCDQGKRYLPETGQAALDKQHPYGGAVKRHMKAWAENDCN
ncbi:hypothetical protein [Neptunicoccus sediminis]|uniref:hypothetical protein n=1 Tax=Neptunicoccus sediminis TaxID=1892596 RepID=UPI0008461AB0|nr:hypothetical protein [Neptunicoccus sediminis]